MTDSSITRTTDAASRAKRLCGLVSRGISVVVLATAVVALLLPGSFGALDVTLINPLLGVVMFGMGLTLRAADLRGVVERPRAILLGCAAQFTIMPLTAWTLARLFALPPDLAIGVILVGCCPGGTASNVITFLAGGDLALSVGMTAASTLLAPLLTPLLVYALAGTLVEVDVAAMFLSVVQIVLLPIVAGLAAQRFCGRLARAVADYLPAFSTLTVAFIVGLIVSHNADKLLTCGPLVCAVVMLHNGCGLALGALAARLLRLPRGQRVALAIEVGMQNSGLASSLATLHFAQAPLATVPGAIFSVWHNLSGAIVAHVALKQGTRNREQGTGQAGLPGGK